MINNAHLFCLYHCESPIFRSDAIIPMQTGCDLADIDLRITKDNTGDHISSKNKNFAELTAWYWVWKNHVKVAEKQGIDYIGFCHYRRFLNIKRSRKRPIYAVSQSSFARRIKKGYLAQLELGDADIYLPEPSLYPYSVEEQYIKGKHPQLDLDILKEILTELHPEYAPSMKEVFAGNKLYPCLIFIMRRDLFVRAMEWAFSLLFELEKRTDWSNYKLYSDIRTPAYLMERFINVWYLHMQKTESVKIRYTHMEVVLADFPWYKEPLRWLSAYINPAPFIWKWQAIMRYVKGK